MEKSLQNQAMALAGIMHCTRLVRQLAHEGRVDEDQFACALQPVFALDVGSIDEIYGSPECRNRALCMLRSQLGGANDGRDPEATCYAAALVHLERKLMRRDDLIHKLREGLEGACAQLEHFPATHENVVARLADLYGQTISTLKPKIMVRGDSRYLEIPVTANRVRALLLSGMRSAVLWHQCGGSRFKLIFGHNRLLQAARDAEPA